MEIKYYGYDENKNKCVLTAVGDLVKETEKQLVIKADSGMTTTINKSKLVKEEFSVSAIDNLIVLKEYTQGLFEIDDTLKNAVDNFSCIGRILCNFKDKEFYKIEGYSDIYQLAFDKFGLSKTSTKNFMNIYLKFGNKNTGYIADEYVNYSYSQLVELLPIDDDELNKYSPKSSVSDIRTFKKISQMSDLKAVECEFSKYSDKVESIISKGVEGYGSYHSDFEYNLDSGDLSLNAIYEIHILNFKRIIKFGIKCSSFSDSFAFFFDIGNEYYGSNSTFNDLLNDFKLKFKTYLNNILSRFFNKKVSKEPKELKQPKQHNEKVVKTNCKLKNNTERLSFLEDINNWTLLIDLSNYNFKIYKSNVLNYLLFKFGNFKSYHQLSSDNNISAITSNCSALVDELKNMNY